MKPLIHIQRESLFEYKIYTDLSKVNPHYFIKIKTTFNFWWNCFNWVKTDYKIMSNEKQVFYSMREVIHFIDKVECDYENLRITDINQAS